MSTMCRIEGRSNFKITPENCEKFLDLLERERKEERKRLRTLRGDDPIIDDDDDDDDSGPNNISDWFEKLGWDAKYKRKRGVTGMDCCHGYAPHDDEKEAFQKVAPFVENGSEIILNFYEFGSYEKWAFEDGKMVEYRGEPEIVWKLSKNQG